MRLSPKKDGLTTLHIAATNNDVHMLDFLLEHRKDKMIDFENEEGWIPAHFAAFMRNYDSLNLLIQHKTNLWHKNKQKMNVFEEIVRTNDDALLDGVYEIYKSKPRDLSEEGGYSLLHLAAGSDGYKVLSYLIDQGEDVNQICNENDRATPLHFAMLSNNFHSAKLLLKFRANPNKADSLGNTPYHFAVATKNQSIMKLIEEYGGNALLENSSGLTSIDYASIEDIKAAKLHFLGIPKYKKVMKENHYL